MSPEECSNACQRIHDTVYKYVSKSPGRNIYFNKRTRLFIISFRPEIATTSLLLLEETIALLWAQFLGMHHCGCSLYDLHPSVDFGYLPYLLFI